MAVNPLIRPLGIAASLLASCQGLAWSVLALLGILLYTQMWTLETDDQSSISTWLYTLFLTDELKGKIIMAGGTTIAFTSVYIVLSLAWMIISLCKLWVVYRQKWEFGKGTIITWSICTGIVSILDIVATSLLGSDFNTLNDLYESEDHGIEGLEYNAISAAGILMTIAARGFVLLIANIVFCGLFLLWGFRFEAEENGEPQREFINGFEQRPQWLTNGSTAGFLRPQTNQGFEPDTNQRPNSFERERYPRISPQLGHYGRSNSKPPNNPQSNLRQQQRGPYIPEPDYSPTSLRKNPKSVLKSRNNY
ncbi:hypothetical protein Trydic_g12971 [Trypoxylus dichotomus]